MSDELRVYEEDFKVIWAMSAFGSGLIGIYLLNTSFNLFEIFIKLPVILASLIFFAFSFYAAFKAAEDLHEIVICIQNGELIVRVFKREEIIKEENLSVSNIKCFFIEPKIKPKNGEAIYDYTSNYYLKYQTIDNSDFMPFIDLVHYTLTLKLEDIERLIAFVQKYNQQIFVISEEFNYIESTIA